MNGILLINKPKNYTSRDVVNQICKQFSTKKVGHTGTLDPIATGVLVICLGKYTKLVDELTSADKEYVATMELGIETDTLDITGTIKKEEHHPISTDQIIQTFQTFPKEYTQTVPKYSAVKINGKKLYEYAREQQDVKLPTRTVQIKELELLKIKDNQITFRTVVSKGTYIRSLIKDLATQMKTVATMTELIRTRQGKFTLEECQELDTINEQTKLLTIQDITSYKEVALKEEEYKKVINGNSLLLNEQDEKILVTYAQKPIALYQKEDKIYRIKCFLI